MAKEAAAAAQNGYGLKSLTSNACHHATTFNVASFSSLSSLFTSFLSN
jgi:hypothetical protein